MRGLRAKTAPIAAAALAAMSVAGCGLSSAGASANIGGTPTGKPITVGISLPLSGGFAADGLASERGYQLWASDLNRQGGLLGRPVKLVILDDKTDENKVKSDYRTLIAQDRVDLVLAPFSSLLTVDALSVTDPAGYALAAGSAGSPLVYAQNSHDLFSTNVPVKIQMDPFARWVASLPGSERPTTAAYPMVDDPFADPPVMATERTLAAAGIKTVDYTPNKPIGNPTPGALRAAADRVIASGAQMVVLGTVDVPSVQGFLKEFELKHYNPKIVIASAGPDQGQAFLGAAGVGNAVGIMVPNGWYGGYPNALSHVMVQDFIATYGGTASDINADVAEAYSAGETLQAGVEGANSVSNPEIIKWLHEHTVQTVLGPVRFGADGENLDAENSAFIFQWQPGGHFVQVLPATDPGTTAKPIVIKPTWSG